MEYRTLAGSDRSVLRYEVILCMGTDARTMGATFLCEFNEVPP